MDDANWAGWLRLQMTPGIGSVSGRNLLHAFGDPATIFTQSVTALNTVVQAKQAQALLQLPPAFKAVSRLTKQWLQSEEPQHPMLVLGDPRYPRALLEIDDPPLVLYAAGSEKALAHLDGARSIAIVGSRNPTRQGLENSRAFGKALAQSSFTVVSGMALGIDAAAHRGALESSESELPTVAVVGTGLDRVYPARHRSLAHRIAAAGALVSEFAPGTPPLPPNFPLRNRIIAGLSLGTLVVEAALQSGSLITARLASEAGREVFAIPGSIHAPQAKGCHALLKQGAKLVETAQDIVEELGPGMRQAALPLGNASEVATAHDDPLLAALGDDPVTLDALMARTGCSADALMAQLMTLELDSHVVRLPGGLYQRLRQG
jgi:DNA processing protein